MNQSINQSINQYSFNKSCQTQLKTAKILAMYIHRKIAIKKIESCKVLCSVTSFVQHTYKKSLSFSCDVLIISSYCGRPSSSCVVSIIGREGKTAACVCYSLKCGGITFHRLHRTVQLLLICH